MFFHTTLLINKENDIKIKKMPNEKSKKCQMKNQKNAK
jgi:hypothetical protein